MSYAFCLEPVVEKSDLIRKDEDYIHSPKHRNSLNNYIANTDKIPHNAAIARLLLITPEEVERIYQESVEALRTAMVKK